MGYRLLTLGTPPPPPAPPPSRKIGGGLFANHNGDTVEVHHNELSLYIKEFMPCLVPWYPYSRYGTLHELVHVINFPLHKKYGGNSYASLHFGDERWVRLIKTWISIHRDIIEDTMKFKQL